MNKENIMPNKVGKTMPVRTRYPWDQMSDGSVYECVRGKDFAVDPKSFYRAAKRYAQRHGLELRSSIQGEKVFVQFLQPKPKQAAAKKRVVRRISK